MWTNKSITKALNWDFPIACISNKVIIYLCVFFFSFPDRTSNMNIEHYPVCDFFFFKWKWYRVNNSHNNRDFIDSITFIKLKSVASNFKSSIQITTNHVIIIMCAKTFNCALCCVAFLVFRAWNAKNKRKRKKSAMKKIRNQVQAIETGTINQN